MKTISHITFCIAVFGYGAVCHATTTNSGEAHRADTDPLHRLHIGVEKQVLSVRYTNERTTEGDIEIVSRSAGFGVAGSVLPTLNLGVRVTDRICVGSYLSAAMNRSAFESGDFTFVTFGVAPYVELWFGQDNIRPFIIGLFDVEFSGNLQESDYSEFSYNGLGFGGYLGGGIRIFVADQISLDGLLTVGYNGTKYEQAWSDTSPRRSTAGSVR